MKRSERARIVLLDDADRLLLFSLANDDGSSRWFTPGGGLQEGETHEQAALRELKEETGLTDVELGPELWRGSPWTAVRDGVEYEVWERFFLVRAPAFEIDTGAFEQLEASTITGHRWWTIDELLATKDLLRPGELAKLVSRLLTEGPPERPITLGR